MDQKVRGPSHRRRTLSNVYEEVFVENSERLLANDDYFCKETGICLIGSQIRLR